MPKEKGLFLLALFKSSLLLGIQSTIQKQNLCSIANEVHTAPRQQLAQNKRLEKALMYCPFLQWCRGLTAASN